MNSNPSTRSEPPAEVELSYRDVIVLVRRHLFGILDRRLAVLPWRVTRMGPRGVEVTLIDEEFAAGIRERAAKRMKKRLTP